MSRRLLITGGAGFIGSNLVAHALRDPTVERILNLDKLTYAGSLDNLADCAADPRHRFVQADIADAATVRALLREESIDTVIHVAAETHVDRSIDSAEPFYQTNVIGTARLIEAFRDHWSAAGKPAHWRFVHVSTDEVYGSLAPDTPPVTEAAAYAPNSPYAASKAASDHVVRAAAHTHGLPVLITHCSNNYGPRQHREKLIPQTILHALAGIAIPVYGDGMNMRDWIHVDDHCAGLLHVLHAGRPGETYNLGGDNERHNIDVVRLLCALLDELRPRADRTRHADLIRFVADRPGHDRRYALDCAKARRELGWAPRMEFLAGLRATVQWYLDHSSPVAP